LQSIAEVTVADVTFIASGSITSTVPETIPQRFASLTLNGRANPADTPVKRPVELVSPLKV
jgi:hypothetical protein